MRSSFYDLPEYRSKLSALSRKAWKAGFFDHLRTAVEVRKCRRTDCTNSFEVKRFDPKRFCSKACAAVYNNVIRGPRGLSTKQRISESLKRRNATSISPRKGKIIVPRLTRNCLTCRKQFDTPRGQNHKYCSVACSIRDIGGRITSPKAARGKSGTRADINPTICFYSRWEANFARILNLLDIKWNFQSRTFDLGIQKYTPDFYLPEHDLFIEIKNFLSPYSYERDKRFRELNPTIALQLILKDDYLELQMRFAPLIRNWEYS